MEITIKGLDKFNATFGKLATQIDYALTLTLNDLAFDARTSLNSEIMGALTARANTSKAFVVDKATKANLSATIRMKNDWHLDALAHHYTGGSSEAITFERVMIARGFMGKGNSAVPVKKIGKTKYRTLIKETRRSTKGKTFVVPVGSKDKRTAHLKPGVYSRLKRKVKPIILFTGEAIYSKRMDMFKTVKKVVTRRVDAYFRRNMAKALGSAR